MKPINHDMEVERTRQRRLKMIPTTAQHSRLVMTMILFLALGFSIALFIIWIRIQIVQVEYEISAATQEKEELLRSQEWLKMTASSLRSPKRIESIATQELGLRPPERHQLRWAK